MAKRKRNSKQRRKRKRGQCKSSFTKALQHLKRMKRGKRSIALASSNDKFIRQFCSQVKRLKFAKVSPSLRKRMKKHRKKIHKLISSKTNMKSKRAMLSNQKGGILPLLLAALPALGSIAGGLLGRV